MKIAVFGIGAIGGYIGGLLANAGEKVSFIARGETLSAIRESGLTLQRGDETFTVKPEYASDNPNDIGVADYIILCVKADALQNAAEIISPMVGPNTVVVPTQNGVMASKQIGSVIGSEKVIEGICQFNARLIKPATVVTGANQPTFNMGESDNTTTERILVLQSAFHNAGFNSVIPENIQVALWIKLMGIAALAGMECVTRTSSAIWSQIPSLKTMYSKSMEETRDVAHSLKIEIPYREIEQRVDRLGSGSRSGTTSLHKDIVEGRPSEIEHQIGDIVRIAKEHNIDTPVNSFLYNCLLPQEKVARKEI